MEESNTLTSLTKRVRDLEKLVNCLCITNFMTQHADGDENARNDAVTVINWQSEKAKDKYRAYEAYRELRNDHNEAEQKMLVIEQDYPELREWRK